jgi:TonB family protein
MSTVRNYTDNSAPDFERRRHARQRLNQLAYLDVGPDNGGIVLDLSEEGMGFYAVAPLMSDEKEINLSIQLPHAKGRLETAAEIVWLGPGNQQAGVCLRGMSSEARVQIQEWIRAQLFPDEPPRGSAPKMENASTSLPKLEPPQTTRKDKWLSLVAELEGQQPLQNPPSAGTSAENAPPIIHDDSRSFIAYRKARTDADQNETPIHRAASKEPPAQRTSHHLVELPLWGRHDQQHAGDGDDASTATSDSKSDHKEVLGWPIREPQIAPPAIASATAPDRPVPPWPAHNGAPECSVPPVKSVDRPTPVVEANANVAATTASTMPSLIAPIGGSHVRRWVLAVVLLTSSCVLCFGIGMWVERPDSQTHVAQPPPELAMAVPVAEAAPAVTKEIDSKRLRVNREKVRTGDATPGSALGNRQHNVAFTASSPILDPTPQPTPAKQSSPFLMAAKPPEDKLALTPAAAQVSVPSMLAERIVAGRRLRPSDRFNPCHLTYRVEPAYPLEAQQQRIEGAVKIHQAIGADGSVQGMKLLSGPPLLVPAAMDAAKYWRYLPALLNGQPVETEQEIEIDFRLPH